MNNLSIQKFIHSRKNLIGIALASIALTLYIIGVIDSFWWLITIGAYTLGVIAGPQEKTAIFYNISGTNLNDYSGFLNRLKKSTEAELPNEANVILSSIYSNSLELIEFIQNKPEGVDSFSEDISDIKKIFENYLPKLLNQYVKLPKKYAENIPTQNGKTTKEMLVEQLQILNEQIKKIAYATYENDANALKIHGRILEQKFSQKELFNFNTKEHSANA